MNERCPLRESALIRSKTACRPGLSTVSNPETWGEASAGSETARSKEA